MTESEQTVCELRSAGGIIQENEIVPELLPAMPDSYQAVTTAIDIVFCQDESEVTLHFVKNKVLMEESRQNKETKTDNDSDVAFIEHKYRSWHK